MNNEVMIGLVLLQFVLCLYVIHTRVTNLAKNLPNILTMNYKQRYQSIMDVVIILVAIGIFVTL